MEDHECREVIEQYRKVLDREYPDIEPNEDREGVGHIKRMTEKMPEFLDDGRKEKFMRWLGFIQGWLWENGLYDIEELGRHNKFTDSF